MPQDAPPAFFSYSRDDSEFALRLAEDLKAAGARVWLDQLDIQPGQRWARAVQDALNNSPRVLVILSPSSVSSTNVDDEVNFALEEHKTIIPVLYRDCNVPFQLRPFQYVDFRNDYARGLKVMLKTLGVEQQAAVSVAAAAVPEERQPVVSNAVEQARLEEGRKQAAVEKARLERQERERLVAAEKARLEQQERERRVAAEQASLQLPAARVRAEQARLEEERRKAAEQRLEEERQQAAEQARLDEERKRAAAEKARLEQERERIERERGGAVAPSLAIGQPALKIALAACGILVVALVVYWATRPKQQEQGTQVSEVQTHPSTPPPSTEVSSGSAAAPDKTAADGATAGKAAVDKTMVSLSVEAMCEKGDDYYYGRRGVPKDYQQAVSWYRKAAEAGNAEGMDKLGWMYKHGWGVALDYQQAVGWYRKAAEAANPWGMFHLGGMYENGDGVGKDYQQAVTLYRKAAQLGNQYAKDALKRLGESTQ